MPTPLIWLALDGVGHPADAPPGSSGEADGPWETGLPTLRPFVDAGLALDATLGVEGLPQSATGQTCWLTGQDGVAAMHGHFGPQPGPTLRRMLDEASLPVGLTRTGRQAALLNFYPPGYFAAQHERPRHGCFPYSFLAAGLPLCPPGLPLLSPTLGLGYRAPWNATDGLDDWRRRGEEVAAVRGYDLLVFDAWFSDLLGHEGRSVPPPGLHLAAGAYLRRLDALLEGLLGAGAAVVLSSDHGNFEDLNVKSHTTARVPFAASGVSLRLPDGRPPTDVLEGGRVLQNLFGL
ncbi:metalloenzyme domain protein [Deinococcus altitudinis]|uniref:metalloenzyme domain protein n=1 Tax=Deinococcus altitudinis TaxID=468914 RepID=UPI003892CB90